MLAPEPCNLILQAIKSSTDNRGHIRHYDISEAGIQLEQPDDTLLSDSNQLTLTGSTISRKTVLIG